MTFPFPPLVHHPLTSPQRDIWFDQLLHADAPLYNIGGYMRLAGRMDVALFNRSVKLLVQKHDVLRTVLIQRQGQAEVEEGVPMQAYADTLPVTVSFHDFSSHENPHEAALAWMRQLFSEPFSLQGEPLFRYALLQLAADSFLYFACYHHLIADGWTIALLARSHAEIYSTLAADGDPDLAAPSYPAFIENDRRYVASPAFATQRQYWLQKFQPLPEPLFAARYHNQVLKQSPPSRSSTLSLPRDWYDRLIAFARNHGATTFHAILGAVYVYFTRTAQRPELVVGLPVLNRGNAAFKATAGLFVGVTAARFSFGMDLSFSELLQAIGRELKQNYRHQRFPTSTLNRDIGRVDATQPQLFDVGVSYERHDYEARFGQARGVAIPLVNEHQTTPLMLYVREFHDDEAVQVDFVYHKAYFTDEEIVGIQQRLVHLLDTVQQAPDASIHTIELLPRNEAARLMGWNQTQRDYPSGATLLDLYAQQVKKHPDHPAVFIDGRQLSYRQLDEQTNRLAHYLMQCQAVCPDTLVGLCMERSPEMIVGMLGILKAGGAYVPLDPAWPAQRLRRMLDDARMPVLLTQKRLAVRLPESQAALICLDADWNKIATYSADEIGDRTLAANLAYVIYTSGSTGEPKGVAVSRGNLLHSTRARISYYDAQPVERFLMPSSFAFDSSVAGIFWTLCSGGTLCLPSEREHNDAVALVRLIERHAISHLLCIPSFHALLLDAARDNNLASLSAVIVAGEACGAELVRRHYAMLPQTTLFNEYGPTEGSVWSTVHRCVPQRESMPVPIGRPIDNVQIHVLDHYLERVPVGVTGELYIAGEGLARGYLGRPDATAEKFIPCPFPGEAGARMYRSGDLGRWLPDGSIEYLGRIDHQVKIHGFRIEPSEVEAALLALPLVREAAVLVREDHTDDKRLVAYAVVHDRAADFMEAQTVSALKGALENILPRHMVPDHFVLLTYMPLTPNGKIDRKALPAPVLSRSHGDYVAPRTHTEAMLAEIWADLLKRDQIGVQDNFFELGGHSLLAAQLVSRLRKLSAVELPLRAIFDTPVLHALAQRIDAVLHLAQAAADAPDCLLAPEPADRSAALPLSFAQQRLWFLDQLERGNTFYNMAGGLRLTGALDVAALEEAINAVVLRHEVLRTAFDIIDGSAVQVIAGHVRVPFVVTDLSALPAPARQAEARRLADMEAAHSFDLRAAPMLRVRLLRLDAHDHWLLLTLHHIASDGWSTAILLREIAAFYNTHVSRRPLTLPVLPLQYADFAVWQRTLQQGARWERELGYWRGQLAGAPALLDLPTDYPRPPIQSYRGARIGFALPGELAARLHALSRETGATLFMTLIGAFGVMLARYSAQDDICIGTPLANRRHAEFEGLIGCFVNTLVLRLKLDGNPSFAQLLRQVRETALAAYAHQDIPFEQLVEVLQPERHLSHAPLFQTMFAMQNSAAYDAVLNGIELQPLDIDLPIAKFDLTLNMWEDADRLHGLFEYNTDLFARATIERMMGHFTTLLAGIAEQPRTPIATLGMLTGAERSFLLEELNRSQQDFPLDKTYAMQFAKQATRHPERIAAVCMDESLTYRELDQRSTRIAHALIAAGAGPNTLVGSMGERNLCFLTMMIAIFKAGAAYVPLDLHHPVTRLREIVSHGGIGLILVSEPSLSRTDELFSGLDRPAAVLVAERFWLDGDAPALPAIGSPDDLAYVIFTSGSTGQPKGAMVEHKGMLNNLYGKVPALDLGPDDCVAQTASPAFDISVWQFLAAPLLGGTVHIMPDHIAHDPQRLLAAVAAQQVSVLQVVPSMMRHLLDVPMQHLSFSLRWVLSIGEALPPSLAQAWFERFPSIPLINIYGPAECADNVAFLALHSAQEAQAFSALASVPIGHPTANMQLFVLDGHLQPIPVGVPGEICIAGVGVGRGYLNDPETSAQAFVAHPFQPGERFYRTGDMGRYRVDGAIDYLGRRDHQIKIRGQRIELGEIESRLRCHPGVRDVAVIGRKEQGAETRIVAYWVPHGDTGTDADALRRELEKSLPHYMMPAHFAMLDQLPINANGKVDRKALSALPWQEAERTFDAPCTSIEERLAEIWSALLGHARIGRDDNFFHLGGHSLLATQVIAHIRKVFGVELPLRTVFEAPALRDLALCIEQAQEAVHSGEPALLPVARGAPLPLSFAQQRLWFLDQLEPGSALYNMPGGLRLTGELDAAALEGALNDIVARHEALRTDFGAIEGETVQRIARDARVPFAVHDLSSQVAEQRQEQAHRLAMAEALRPFDLRHAPLLRAQLLRLDEREHWLLLTLHHIAADGWSTGIVLRELAAFYRARRTGMEPGLPILPIQYADFAVWQRAWLQGERHERQLAYWRAQLAGAPALLDLPSDHLRPAVQSYQSARLAFDIDDTLTAGLHALGRRMQATLFMTLSSAFALLLARYSRQDDICIGTPVANRQRYEVENLIGFFVNTLVLRFKLNGGLSFAQLLQQTRETALAAYAHQDMPFEQLVEALQPERHLSHSPLFQVMFVLQNASAEPVAWPAMQVEPLHIDAPAIARFDLTLHVTEQDKHLQAVFEFNSGLFEQDSIARLSRHFRHLLEAIVARPDAAIADLPLLSGEERHQLLVEWNRTRTPLPAHQTIHQLFEGCVQDHPGQIAAVFQERQLSYAELNAKANRLAHYLREQGVCADELVGICAERSLEMIIAVLGVLKAGGAYLPLDPALPPARMTYMIEDARPRLLLTQAHLLDRLPKMAIEHVCLDRDASLFSAWPDDNPPAQTLPDHLAYVIYTSGSTGNPKGTLLHHRGLVNLVLAQREALHLQAGTRVLQWASFNFDASVSEFFTALTAGAQLYLVPSEAVLPGQNLFETLQRNQIELVTLTPSSLSSLSALPLEPLPELKTLVVAGEHCDHALIAPWMKRYTVINAYGPTEATVCATVYPCMDDGQHHPPIGRPIANTQTYILDAYLHPVPIGVTGELYIAGEGLARGYLGRPDLTAERFTQNPFSDQPGARMYKTGDLARYRSDGQIEYVGRIDHQVKIRGYRVELGEIEFALNQLPTVREAVVLAQDAPAGGQLLVAYVVQESAVAAQFTSGKLREALCRTLPDYMVPAHVAFLERIPVNTNGKIDRKALEALGWEDDELVYAAPCTPIEERLAAIWCELLTKKRIGRDDNFFHIGGHSLLAVRLMARINDAFGLSLPLSQIFLSPTIATLAAAIDTRQTAAQLVVPLKQGGHAAPLWLIHPAGGTVFCYQKLASRLDDAHPVYAIQSPEIAGLDIGPYDIDALCQRYASEIIRLQADGPLYLAGWSLGGALSLRIADILERAGRHVGWVGLFDTMLRQDEKPLSFEEFIVWAMTRVQPETFASDKTLEAAHMRATQYVEARGIEDLAHKLSGNPHCLTDELGLDEHYVAFLQRQYRIQRAHIALMANFSPSRINAPLHVFRAEESVRQGVPEMDWLAHTNAMQHSTQYTLPGHHENLVLLEENIDTIVQIFCSGFVQK